MATYLLLYISIYVSHPVCLQRNGNQLAKVCANAYVEVNGLPSPSEANFDSRRQHSLLRQVATGELYLTCYRLLACGR